LFSQVSKENIASESYVALAASHPEAKEQVKLGTENAVADVSGNNSTLTE